LTQQAAQSPFKCARLLGLAFPNDSHVPTLSSKSSFVPLISLNGRFKFVHPKFAPGVWNRCAVFARMTMPETSMYKDCELVFRQHDVWLAGQINTMQPKPAAQLMQLPANNHFWFCVFAPYA
jgi:hypothetical protein